VRVKLRKHQRLWLKFWGNLRLGSHVHHIKPRSQGGTDTIGNLIELHPDDHYLIHKLRGDKWAHKANFMRMSGHVVSDDTKRKISEANKGNKQRLGHTNSAEHRMRISNAKTGVKNPKIRSFSLEVAEEIRKIYKFGGFSMRRLAKAYKSNHHIISDIINKRNAYEL